MEKLWRKIEILRQKMHEIALEKGLSHPDVVIASQNLDEAISEFYHVNLTQKAG